jgi:molybdopterin converting factor small subunit
MNLQVILPDFIADLLPSDAETRGCGKVEADAENLAGLHESFQSRFPEIAEKLWDGDGQVRKNVILVLNDELLQRSDYDSTAFRNGDELNIILQFAGG